MAMPAMRGEEGPSDSAELPGLDENHREVAAAEAGTAPKTASIDPRQASVKAAGASILEAICAERTAGGQELRGVPPGVIGQRMVSRGVVSAIPSIVCR